MRIIAMYLGKLLSIEINYLLFILLVLNKRESIRSCVQNKLMKHYIDDLRTHDRILSTITTI